jgi:hypothetical protein
MKTSDYNWGDDIIDSRCIISRYEELKNEKDSLEEAVKEAQEELDDFVKDDDDTIDDLKEALEVAKSYLCMFNTSEDDELKLLQEIVKQGDSSPDWSYGEALIHENYFTQYTEELVDDCYDMPKEFSEGKWPWNHVNMDWEAAANELKNDYFDITVDGETYYIRG